CGCGWRGINRGRERPLRRWRSLSAGHENSRPAGRIPCEGPAALPSAGHLGRTGDHAMSHPLSHFLETVQVTAPREAAGLQVFGLRREAGTSLRYTTLDDALAAGTLEVTEVNDAGSVPTLLVRNKADGLVFLMAGEQLVGAKQNRVLN